MAKAAWHSIEAAEALKELISVEEYSYSVKLEVAHARESS